jgi:hypothetical protein
MTEYAEILNAEIAAEAPLKQATLEKMRDNPEAVHLGDATVPNNRRIDPYGFKRVAAGSVAIIRQERDKTRTGSDELYILEASIVVPGVYRFAGTNGNTSTRIRFYVNNVMREQLGDSGSPTSGAWTYDLTAESGDWVEVSVARYAGGTPNYSLSDFRMMADYVPPMGGISKYGI